MTGTVLKYPGSKNQIADRIISLFPDDYRGMTYLEPFFGSGTIFFRKAPGVVETVNDLNEEVYNLFTQIRENGEELARLIEYTPWSRREYEESYTTTESDIENARRFLVRSWMSIGSNVYRTGWRHNIKGNSFGIYKLDEMSDLIKAVFRRLRPKAGNVVQIENRDAFSLIEKYNRPNVLMYLDPPYVLNTRKNKKIYRHEFTDDDHIRLCAMINGSAAKVALSGYANTIYEERLRGFSKTAFSSFDETGRQRTEAVWTNYAATRDLFGGYGEEQWL